jgi:hypothetical protein
MQPIHYFVANTPCVNANHHFNADSSPKLNQQSIIARLPSPPYHCWSPRICTRPALFPRTARPRTAGLQVHMPKDHCLPIHSKRLQSTKAAKYHLRSLRVLKLAFVDPCPGWDTLLDPTISSLGTSFRCPFTTADVCASFRIHELMVTWRSRPVRKDRERPVKK